MRLHQLLLFSAIAFVALAPAQKAHAATIAGTASFLDTGPSGNNLNFTGVFNPSNAFNFNLNYGLPVTLTNFLTITATDTNFNLLSTATDTIKTTFNFTQPGSGSGSVFGSGEDTSLFFVFDNGNIHWNGPAVVNFGNLDLTITLSDASFSSAFAGILTAFPSVGIDATFSLTGTSDVVSQTPLPAALPLFATGLAALGLLGWWRRKWQHGSAGALG